MTCSTIGGSCRILFFRSKLSTLTSSREKDIPVSGSSREFDGSGNHPGGFQLLGSSPSGFARTGDGLDEPKMTCLSFVLQGMLKRNSPFFWSHPLNGTHILFLATCCRSQRSAGVAVAGHFRGFLGLCKCYPLWQICWLAKFRDPSCGWQHEACKRCLTFEVF